jgi:hypothetical protein
MKKNQHVWLAIFAGGMSLVLILAAFAWRSPIGRTASTFTPTQTLTASTIPLRTETQVPTWTLDSSPVVLIGTMNDVGVYTLDDMRTRQAILDLTPQTPYVLIHPRYKDNTLPTRVPPTDGPTPTLDAATASYLQTLQALVPPIVVRNLFTFTPTPQP